MSQSNYLVIDGICNAIGRIQCQPNIVSIQFSICSGDAGGCDVWLVDGISASHGLHLGNLSAQQTQLELQITLDQLSSNGISPMRAGLCLTREGAPVAQGFPGGAHFSVIPFFQNLPATTLPPFSAHFGHPYGLELTSVSVKQLPIQGKCQKLIAQDQNTWHCCERYGGYYWQPIDDVFLFGIPWTPENDPLPLLPLLPVQAFLSPLQPDTFGCLLLGLSPLKDQFFPVIFR